MKKLDVAGNVVYTALAGLVAAIVVLLVVVIIRSLVLGA